jgi:hypothetical protein
MLFPDRPTERPIVRSARASQLFHRQCLVAGIEQDRIHVFCGFRGFLNRFGTGHMDDLHDRDARQRVLQSRDAFRP